jgi:hypothetical protein
MLPMNLAPRLEIVPLQGVGRVHQSTASAEANQDSAASSHGVELGRPMSAVGKSDGTASRLDAPAIPLGTVERAGLRSITWCLRRTCGIHSAAGSAVIVCMSTLCSSNCWLFVPPRPSCACLCAKPPIPTTLTAKDSAADKAPRSWTGEQMHVCQ